MTAFQPAFKLHPLAQHLINPIPNYRWLGGLIVDNFAGGGGASTGIWKALGVSPDIAVNHDAKALAMHKRNHPETKHYNESVWDIDVREATGGRPVLFGWFSPDCFPAGTLVLTMHGYAPIETLKVGDWVQTHKNRWRQVTATMVSQKPVMTVRGRGHHGLRVSSEHPFYVRKEKYAKRSEWVNARELQVGSYWATPCGVENSNVSIPPVGGRGMDLSLELMRLAGYYVGNGCSRLTPGRSDLILTTHKDKANDLEDWLSQWNPAGKKCQYNELAWHRRDTSTATQFTAGHKGLVEWLRYNFGHLAENKKVPGWLYQAGEATREAFLRGYLEADGYFKHGKHEATSVSKQLIYGLKMLATSLGKSVSVYSHHQNDVIQGRKVNCRPSWCIRWLDQVQPGREQTWRDEGMEWGKIKEVGPAEGLETVYNISVEEDESYVVEGLVVHNCTHFSIARGSKPVKKNIRGLAWIVKKWAGQSDMAIFALENVKEFQTWGPLIAERDKKTGRVIKLLPDPNGGKDKKGNLKMIRVVAEPGERVPVQQQALIPDKKRSGKTFRQFLAQLRAMGYVIEWNDKMRADDYGDPTQRKRLLMIGRKDGLPCDSSPVKTHGNPKAKDFNPETMLPWKTAGEHMDWSLECESIFKPGRKLAEKTMERIAKGIKKFVIDAGDEAFIVKVNHTGYDQFRGQSLDEPMQTITAVPGQGVVEAKLVAFQGTMDHRSTPDTSKSLDEPLTAITSKARHMQVSAMLKNFTGVVGQAMDKPAPTITATDHNSVVTAELLEVGHVQRDFGNSVGQTADAPLGAITAGGGGKAGVVISHLMKLKGTCKDGQPCDEPIHTIQGQGNHYAEVTTSLAEYHNSPPENGGENGARTVQGLDSDGRNGGQDGWHSLEAGQSDQQGQVKAGSSPAGGHTVGQRLPDDSLQLQGEGLPHIGAQAGLPGAGGADTGGVGHQPQGRREAQQRAGEFGAGDPQRESPARLPGGAEEASSGGDSQCSRSESQGVEGAGSHVPAGGQGTGVLPDDSLQGRAYRVNAWLMKYYATGAIGQGLDEPVHTIRAGDTFALVTIQGVDYQIVDIGMRMLQPHELYACQGFPEDYEHVDVGLGKPLTKAEQTRMVGNSVPPGMAAAWVRANVPLWALGNRNAAMAA